MVQSTGNVDEEAGRVYGGLVIELRTEGVEGASVFCSGLFLLVILLEPLSGLR